jgi:hypothetical protein
MMGLFSFMYYSSFIKVYANVSVASILQTAINGLAPQQQLELYTSLREYLVGQELLLLQA